MSMKTAEALRREIAYFSGQLLRTTSRDRIRRAHVAIRKREAQLQDVLRAERRPDAHLGATER